MLSNSLHLQTIVKRFNDNSQCHPGIHWAMIEAQLNGNSAMLESLSFMESSGGEPMFYWLPGNRLHGCWVDSALESPSGRRSLCYDQEARVNRKEFAPANSAIELAASNNLAMLNEEEYLTLQLFVPIDRKTSSWLLTPDSLRTKGGALFGDHRYGRTFIYHNGAQSYYASRGFRAKLVTNWKF